MCGVAGFIYQTSAGPSDLQQRVRRMTSAIHHRGPDDVGTWFGLEDGVALGHRRLSIIDLSPAGHQPMASAHDRFIIVFNGEIYNTRELKAELESTGGAPAWRGHSDTEILLACIEYWGLEEALKRTVGMFALALWDKRDRTLHLTRDRFGEKPLYYGWIDGSFVFASELKAIRGFSGSKPDVCREALAQYLRFTYVPAPRSIYKGIYKLEPGCLLSVGRAAPKIAPAEPLRAPGSYGSATMRRWWSLSHTVKAGAEDLITDERAAIELLEETLTEAVRLQSIADVPLGAFLSGGVDSSMIVALMQRQASKPVRTFTIGFEEREFDESSHARAVAAHLGTIHSEMYVSSADARAVIPMLPRMYDEPFADSSQIPTHLVCRAAREHVTVALSGDGGDEIFGGYNRYFWGPRIWNHVSWLPYPVRRSLGAAISTIPVQSWDAANDAVSRFVPRLRSLSRAGDKAHKLAARLNVVRQREDLYLTLVSEWQNPEKVLAGAGVQEPRGLLSDPLPMTGVEDERLQMMYRDTLTYLPDDILCKVDRAAMSVSLETRVPFLDHRVAELAWRLPVSMKIRDGVGKWAMRQILYKYVPKNLIERPKAGFGVPVGDWLRDSLRDWAEELLSERSIAAAGFFEPDIVRDAWRDHLLGRRDHTHRLWSILMFQAWLRSDM
jgi:asparagine synthase (glutamine-hydrolysing)